MTKTVKNVLIVEDNAVQSMLMERLVEELDHEVVGIVDKGEKAIAKTAELEPDLIIMDVFLNGDMTGIQAMQQIRIQHNSDVPVIYISGNSDRYYVQEANKTSFSIFLFKPIRKKHLFKAFSAIFGKNVDQVEPQGSILKKWTWPFNK